MSGKLEKRKQENARLKAKQERKAALKKLRKHFLPLMIAIALWLIAIIIIHLPGIKQAAFEFFVGFTLESSVAMGKLFFLPVESHSFPYITVDGYTMKVVMECTAYNFYIFVIFLSLLSPVSWKNRLITLGVFLAAVFVVNNLRFYVMGFIGKNNPEWFDYTHDYLWNILFGLMVFLIWVWRYKKVWDKEMPVSESKSN